MRQLGFGIEPGKRRVLAARPGQHVHGHVRSRKQGVDEEAVARVNHLFCAQVEHDQVRVQHGAAPDLRLALFAVPGIQIAAFAHIGQGHDLPDAVVLGDLDDQQILTRFR